MHGRGVRGCVGLYRGNVLEDVDYVHLLGVPILINYIVQGLVLLSCVRYDLSGEVSITESFGYSPAHKHLLGRLVHVLYINILSRDDVCCLCCIVCFTVDVLCL